MTSGRGISALAHLEQDAAALPSEVTLTSIAISLKRIADALERSAAASEGMLAHVEGSAKDLQTTLNVLNAR